MAQTTTAVNAAQAVVSLDNSLGVLTDISGSFTSATLTFDNEVGEYRRADSDFPTRYLLGQDLKIGLKIVYSTAGETEALGILQGWVLSAGITSSDARTIRIDIPDSSSGSTRVQAEVVPASIDIPADVADGAPILVSAALECSGAYAVSEIS